MMKSNSCRSLILGLGLFLLAIGIMQVAMAKPTLAASQIPTSRFTIEQLQQAADAGDPDAQYAIGYMYYYGKNVAEDKQQAMNWIKRAAVQGQPQAVKALAILGQPVVVASPIVTTPVVVSSPVVTKITQPVVVTSPTVTKISQPVVVTSPVVTKIRQPAVVISPSRTTIEPAGPVPPNVNQNSFATPTTVTRTQSSQRYYSEENGVTSVKPSPQTVKKQPSDTSGQRYTIQLTASAKQAVLNNYIKVHHLQGKTNQYQTTRGGKPWYVLVYGLYNSKEEAQAALRDLPASIRAQKPWVRPADKNTSSTSKSRAKKTKSTSSAHKKQTKSK